MTELIEPLLQAGSGAAIVVAAYVGIIRGRLDAIIEEMRPIRIKLDTIEDRTSRLDERVLRLEKAVNGHGSRP